ncbi:hypothetical protein Areg01_40020 [Actinoplanes regularis]|nr:hypothetical protein Areg01_40020 [Actinoplanes regularis]
MSDASDVLRWLADEGFTPLGEGRWRWQEIDGRDVEEMPGSDVAFHCSDALLGDERLSVGERVRRLFATRAG